MLRRTPVPAASLPHELAEPPAFVDIFLIAPLSVTAGDRLAIVLTYVTGDCAIASADVGDTYATGNAYFDARPNPPSWIREDFAGTPSDLPFQTRMEVPGAGGSKAPCVTRGVGCVPVPSDLPICRCLCDEGLNEFPRDLAFSGKSLKALDARKVTLKAPATARALPGSAVVTYGGRSFQVDTSIPAERLGGVGLPKKTP